MFRSCTQTNMILYNSVSELADSIIQISELDYDYAYNLEDLRQGYYILKRRNGSKQELLNILNELQDKERLETDLMLIRSIGDSKKEEGLMKIAFVEEGGNTIDMDVFSCNYIIMIYRCEDNIPWEIFNDYLTLDHDKANWDPDEDMTQDVFRYKGKIKTCLSLTIRPDNFNKDDF